MTAAVTEHNLVAVYSFTEKKNILSFIFYKAQSPSPSLDTDVLKMADDRVGQKLDALQSSKPLIPVGVHSLYDISLFYFHFS